jgi:DNA-binding response OmpR family regulator
MTYVSIPKRLAEFFRTNQGETLTKDQVFQAGWGEPYRGPFCDNTLWANITFTRRLLSGKLCPVKGVGYVYFEDSDSCPDDLYG